MTNDDWNRSQDPATLIRVPVRTLGLTLSLTNFYHNFDGSLWGSIGNAVRGNCPNAAAAPATVSGESFVICHWESRTREGGARYRPASQETCRQPWSHAKM